MEVYEKHAELFHYTSHDGVVGILTSRNLRATHYKFLNDTSELQLMRHELAKRLFPFVKGRVVDVYRSAGLKKRREMKNAGRHRKRRDETPRALIL